MVRKKDVDFVRSWGDTFVLAQIRWRRVLLSPVQSSPPHALCFTALWGLSHGGLVVQAVPQRFDTRHVPEARVEVDATTRVQVRCTPLVDSTEWPGGSARADVRDIRYASASPASENNCVPSLI